MNFLAGESDMPVEEVGEEEEGAEENGDDAIVLYMAKLIVNANHKSRHLNRDAYPYPDSSYSRPRMLRGMRPRRLEHATSQSGWKTFPREKWNAEEATLTE